MRCASCERPGNQSLRSPKTWGSTRARRPTGCRRTGWLASKAPSGNRASPSAKNWPGGAATIAAAQAPELVTAIVEINPFTKSQRLDVGALFTVRRYRRGMARLMGTLLLKSPRLWRSYLDVAYPGKPDECRRHADGLMTALRRPGRWEEFMKTGKTTPADAEAHLPGVRCPALVIMGSEDPDFPDPVAEGEAIVAAMPPGIGRVAVVDGGHYPHSQFGDRVAELILPFSVPGAVWPGHTPTQLVPYG